MKTTRTLSLRSVMIFLRTVVTVPDGMRWNDENPGLTVERRDPEYKSCCRLDSGATQSRRAGSSVIAA